MASFLLIKIKQKERIMASHKMFGGHHLLFDTSVLDVKFSPLNTPQQHPEDPPCLSMRRLSSNQFKSPSWLFTQTPFPQLSHLNEIYLKMTDASNLRPPASNELWPLDVECQSFVGFSIGWPAIDLIQKRENVDRISFLHWNNQFEKEIVDHALGEGRLKISVTKKRFERIMKQRPKRLKKLEWNPQLFIPYQFRDKGPKHISRSITAKNWRRTDDGKFDY